MIEKCKTCLSGYPSVECVNCGTGLRNYRPYKPPTNADRIRGLNDEELANELTRNPPIPCRMCEYWDCKLNLCRAWTDDFTCTTGYAEALTLDWLKQPAETEGAT